MRTIASDARPPKAGASPGKRVTKSVLQKAAKKAAARARVDRARASRRAVATPASLEMGAADFKARCLQVMDEVNSTGRSVVITKHGKPVAQLTPPPAPKKRSKSDSGFGCMKGRIKFLGDGDIVSPVYTAEEYDRMMRDKIERVNRGAARGRR